LKTQTPFSATLLGRVPSFPNKSWRIVTRSCVTDEQQIAHVSEVFMTRFSVGDQVIVRWGREEGQRAKIMQSQPDDVYKVKVENGSVLFFSGKGLAKEEVQPVVSGKW
jgi:hypothetical protein